MSIDASGLTPSRAYPAGGFTADYDVLFYASTQFHETQRYVYAISVGLVGDLAQTAGMAGDDTAAHNFATVYEPAAQTVVKGIGNVGEAMATIASRLLGMATNYLTLEDSIARLFTGAIDIASPLRKMPQRLCEPSEDYLRLPMATGSKEVHDLPVIGEFWPQGNPDMLRTAARIWAKAAELSDDAQLNATRQQQLVTDNCSGAAVDAFVEFARKLYVASPSKATSVSDNGALMENLSAACRKLGQVCDHYADHISDTRTTMIEIAVVIGVATAAGVALTIFTLGASDAAAAAADAAAVAEAAAAAEALAAAAAADTAATALTAEIPVIEAELTQLVATGAAANTNALIGTGIAAGVAATVGLGTMLTPTNAEAASLLPPRPPIPPNVPPAFPIYGPMEQAANAQWVSTLDSRDPNYGTAEDRAYQARVAGIPERRLDASNGERVWADGYRPTDGALVEAKHVRELDCSAR